jgi:hypothetical protein
MRIILPLLPDPTDIVIQGEQIIPPAVPFTQWFVIQGELPAKLRDVAELYVGCVAGALAADAYLGIINETGFTAIDIKAVKRLDLPDEYMLKYISAGDLAAYRASGAAVLSVTVVGTRPSN